MDGHFITKTTVNMVAAAMLAVLSAGAVQHAAAQNYPQRPVRIIVNVSPGGGVDIVARIVGQHYAAIWDKPFIVDNRSGAGGNIGVDLVVKAPADGYTLLVGSSTVVTNAAAHPEIYNPVRDLRAVAKLVSGPYIICVGPALPVASIKDLIVLAKSKPGGLTFASSGTGGILHMGAELLALKIGMPMTHVPYKGVADAYPAVINGQVDWVLGAPLSSLPLVKSGRLKGIAITSPARSKSLPDIPTVAETLPGYDVVSWFSMFAPANTPSDIIAKLNAESRRALQTPEMLRRMEAESTDVGASSPAEFAAEVKSDYEKWQQVVAKTGIKF